MLKYATRAEVRPGRPPAPSLLASSVICRFGTGVQQRDVRPSSRPRVSSPAVIAGYHLNEALERRERVTVDELIDEW